MGSRFGGIKQLAQIGPSGETVMDYAVHDAVRAGLSRVVFVIRRDLERDFREVVGARYEGWVDVAYAFQELDDLPAGRRPPQGRTKPWGTGQAVWAARHVVSDPFVVINADDFYGRSAFEQVAGFLAGGGPREYALVAYRLANTLSENGSVSRGVCEVGDSGRLVSVTEHTSLTPSGDAVVDASGARFTGEEPVSMNFWGLRPDVFGALEERFATFLDTRGGEPSAELYLPAVVDAMVSAGEATVQVLRSDDHWFGVTYSGDAPRVAARVQELVDSGAYPGDLRAGR